MSRNVRRWMFFLAGFGTGIVIIFLSHGGFFAMLLLKSARGS